MNREIYQKELLNVEDERKTVIVAVEDGGSVTVMDAETESTKAMKEAGSALRQTKPGKAQD